MNVRGIVCLVLLPILAGCSARSAGRPTAFSIAPDSLSVPMKNDSTPKPNEIGGKETCLGPVVARGKLFHTKGRLGSLGDYLLGGDFLTGGVSGYNWKPEYEALVGKEVEAKGVHYRYRCGPIEQCLEGGVINYLREIEYLKAVE